MWGDARATKNILVDGHYFNITSNLEAAFWTLTSPFGTSIIWADAICINRDDVDERSQQVGKMRSIYWHARKVHVYINDEEGIGNAAFKLIYDLLLNMGNDGISHQEHEETRYHPYSTPTV
jgi:hypothetical protein